jgi:hypothetical protein
MRNAMVLVKPLAREGVWIPALIAHGLGWVIFKKKAAELTQTQFITTSESIYHEN